MKAKRFTAANMQTALRLVSQELGPDAVIVSSRKTAEGMEVVAALDYHSQSAAPELERQLQLQQELEQAKTRQQQRTPARTEQRAARLQQAREADVGSQASLAEVLRGFKNDQLTSAAGKSRAAAVAQPQSQPQSQPRRVASPVQEERPLARPQPAAVSEVNDTGLYNHALEQMQGQLRELKDWMVSHNGSPWDTRRPLTWQQSQMWARCQDLGLEPAWADDIAARVTSSDLDQAWQQVLTMLQDDIPVASTQVLERGGMVALVGPTGAGKTTTIGKIAAQFVMRHGAGSVALVTLDNYRVAAHDQLRSFSRILGVPLHVLPVQGDLNKLLDTLKDKKLVLVDSAGLSSRDQHFDVQLAMLKQAGSRLKKLLVLPLTSQGRCLQENYELFKPAGLSGCVFTKLDECFSLGAAMSVAALTRLPVTLVTDGPHIPDDIHYPEAAKLVRLAEQMARMARTRWQAATAMTERSRPAANTEYK